MALEGTVPRDVHGYVPPIYVHTGYGSPMADVLDTLFVYGLVGVCGAFVWAVSTARLRLRWTWAFVNAASMLLLFGSLMTQFVLRHGDGSFVPAAEGRYPYLRGTFHYPLSDDLDPFILTAPKEYCQLEETIGRMDEEEIKDWFAEQAKDCPGP